ncbi:hypothetical protein M0R72_16265 [Candidatus Pacearchaeota archaeon]|jgi:hypothetical protein|nr:hypothetical protein [Candidatus Pacearchaeota archaeon]
MGWRVTEEEVKAIIETGNDYAGVEIVVAPFIDAANALTDKIESEDDDGLLTDALLAQIEKFLAAHLYAHRDQQYASESRGGASASYQGQFGMGLDSTRWGQTAKILDVTGYLANLGKAKTEVDLFWMGLPPSEQTDYEDRD